MVGLILSDKNFWNITFLTCGWQIKAAVIFYVVYELFAWLRPGTCKKKVFLRIEKPMKWYMASKKKKKKKTLTYEVLIRPVLADVS